MQHLIRVYTVCVDISNRQGKNYLCKINDKEWYTEKRKMAVNSFFVSSTCNGTGPIITLDIDRSPITTTDCTNKHSNLNLAISGYVLIIRAHSNKTFLVTGLCCNLSLRKYLKLESCQTNLNENLRNCTANAGLIGFIVDAGSVFFRCRQQQISMIPSRMHLTAHNQSGLCGLQPTSQQLQDY